MKKLIVLLVLLMASRASADIVNNAGGTLAADSVTMQFTLVDSSGNPGPTLVNGDTIHVSVCYPSGAVAYSAALAYNAANVTALPCSIDSTYELKFLVADIDGTGVDGFYSWRIMTRDSSLHLWNYAKGTFQLYQARDYNVAMTFLVDSLQAVIDSLQLYDGWLAKEATAARDTVLQTVANADIARDTVLQTTGNAGIVTANANIVRDTLLQTTGNANLVTANANIVRDTLLQTTANSGIVTANANLVRDTLLSDSIINLPGLDTSLYGYVEDFYLVDSAFFDTTRFAAWFIANVGTTAASNWSNALRDSVVAAITLLYGPLDVDVVSISTDTAAANNLENILDGTGTASVAMGSLTVSGANGASGSLVVTNSTGPGYAVTGTTFGGTVTGSAGPGIAITGTTDGALLTATAGDGFEATGTTAGIKGLGTGGGHGIWGYTTGTGSGHGIFGQASSTTGDGIYGYSTNRVGIYAVAGPASNSAALAAYNQSANADFGLGVTHTSIINSLWNIPFATAFTAGSMGDSLTNSSYVQGAAAGLDSTTVAGAVQAILGAGNFTWRTSQFIIKTGTAGNAGDTAAFWIGNTSTDQNDAAMSVVSNAGKAIYAYSSEADNGVVDIAGAAGVAGPVVRVRQAGTGEAVKSEITNTANTNQVEEVTHAGKGGGIMVQVLDTAAAVMIVNSGTTYATPTAGAGEGLLVKSERGNAVTHQAGGTTANENYAYQAEGATYLHGRASNNEDGVQMRGTGTSRGLYVLTETGEYGIRISADTPIYAPGVFFTKLDTLLKGGSAGSTDTTQIKTMLNNNPGIVGSDTASILALAENHPATFFGPSGSGLGSGLYAVTVYAIDTAGTDSALADVRVTARDAAGGLAADGTTNGSGYVTFSLDAATYSVLARRAGYNLTTQSVVVSGAVTDTVPGYNAVDANLCRIYGYLADLGAGYVKNAIVTASLDKERVYDTCNGTLIFDKRKTTTPTGTDGYWWIDLVHSSCIGGEKYTLSVTKPGGGVVTKKVEIPDSTTYNYKWGN